MECQIDLNRYQTCLADCHPIQVSGKVSDVVGLVVEAVCPMSRIGSVCDIYPQDGSGKLTAEVVGFRENKFAVLVRAAGSSPEMKRLLRRWVPVCWVG